MSGPVQPANSRTAMGMPTPNTNELCITLMADYSNGKIGKDNTIGHILEAFWESYVYERATPVQIQTMVSAYIRMLNQAESAWEIVALQGRGAQQVWDDITQEECRGSPGSIGPQPKDTGAVVEYGTDELQGTADLEMSPGRKGAGKSMFTWARDKDSEINILTPSQELTYKLIWNQIIDIKIPKHNLFSARGLPEFPDSKWVKVLQGKVVDLNVIISGIHSIVTNNWVIGTFRDFEFHFGHLKPIKIVRNHGDWLIAYSTFQCAMQFIYPTESQNSFNMVSMSPLTLCPLMQEGKTTSSTLTKQSAAGLDPLTMCHLTSSRSLDFSKCDTSSVKQQETKMHRGISEECLYGEGPMLVVQSRKVLEAGVWVLVQTCLHRMQKGGTCWKGMHKQKGLSGDVCSVGCKMNKVANG